MEPPSVGVAGSRFRSPAAAWFRSPEEAVACFGSPEEVEVAGSHHFRSPEEEAGFGNPEAVEVVRDKHSLDSAQPQGYYSPSSTCIADRQCRIVSGHSARQRKPGRSL